MTKFWTQGRKNRNFGKKNKKSAIFFNVFDVFFPEIYFFQPWIQNLVILELGFELCVKNHHRGWLEMYGNQTIATRKQHFLKSFFMFFDFRFFRPWLQILVILELGFEISVENAHRSRLEMSGKQKLGRKGVAGSFRIFFCQFVRQNRP